MKNLDALLEPCGSNQILCFFNAASWKTTKLGTNMCTICTEPNLWNVCLWLWAETHMKYSVTPYAERLDLIMVWVVYDSASHNVYMLATHPSAPSIQSMYKMCVFLLRNGIMSRTMGVVFPLLYRTCEIVPVVQRQDKKCNSNFNIFLSTKGVPKMQLQVKQKKKKKRQDKRWFFRGTDYQEMHTLEKVSSKLQTLIIFVL